MQAEVVPERNEEGKAYTKKEKAALQRAAAREVEATAAAESKRMDPEASTLSHIFKYNRTLLRLTPCAKVLIAGLLGIWTMP